MEKIRKIIHIDMDAFYASVEQRDAPQLKGRPVIVGGDPDSRGVVAACSYEARRYGIHSAMSSSRAYKLCPTAVFMRPRFDAYIAVSKQIREIFKEYTDIIEPLSLDEAFLDVTRNKPGTESATKIAREIRAKIHETTGLTASAGVSFNKFLAKVASDYHKPDGITVITPDRAERFIDALPVGKFFGVGRVTEDKMHSLGIRTGADLKGFSLEELTGLFGKAGGYFYKIAHSRDDRPVSPERVRKSIGKETTLGEDTSNMDMIKDILTEIAGKIAHLLERSGRYGRRVTLKVKYFDFMQVTRSVTVDEPPGTGKEIMRLVNELLKATEAGEKKVRLLGISISGFSDEKKAAPVVGNPLQLSFPFMDP
ncbi:MAG: DNA polymerase IV [bacterium]|nr:DNA polymerase IV [bacterium]